MKQVDSIFGGAIKTNTSCHTQASIKGLPGKCLTWCVARVYGCCWSAVLKDRGDICLHCISGLLILKLMRKICSSVCLLQIKWGSSSLQANNFPLLSLPAATAHFFCACNCSCDTLLKKKKTTLFFRRIVYCHWTTTLISIHKSVAFIAQHCIFLASATESIFSFFLNIVLVWLTSSPHPWPPLWGN